MQTLIITEKPSVAQAIAAVVGAITRKDGCFEGNGYLVGWCLGHLAQLVSAEAYDPQLSRWRVADLPITAPGLALQGAAGQAKTVWHPARPHAQG